MSKIDEVIAVLEDNQNLINNNEFDQFFTEAENRLDLEGWKLLLQSFQKANIDFLPYIHYIPENYLEGNKEVTEIKVPEGITNIRYGAFVECSNLQTIYLPNTLQKIELNVFAGCDLLKKVYYNGTKHQWRRIHKTTVNNGPLFRATINCIDGDIHYYTDENGKIIM